MMMNHDRLNHYHLINQENERAHQSSGISLVGSVRNVDLRCIALDVKHDQRENNVKYDF